MNLNDQWTESEKLFRAYLDGNAVATNRLFEMIGKALTAYFRARIGNSPDAADLVQVTLLKIHFARDRYDTTKSLKTWVFTIASRSLIDHWRGAQTLTDSLTVEEDRADDLLNSIPSEILTPDEKVRLNNDLNKALETLKPMDRSIVYLYGVEGCSMAEIAAMHGLSEAATKIRAHRAYLELRKVLAVFVLIMTQF